MGRKTGDAPPAAPAFTIIVDTREQKPYRFSNAETATLKTGDYSIRGMEHLVAVERKRVEEMFQMVGRERKRFVRELERFADGGYRYAAIVIEGDLRDFLAGSTWSKVSPRAVINSLVSWSIGYGVHVWFGGSRESARALTYRILEKAHARLSRDEAGQVENAQVEGDRP